MAADGEILIARHGTSIFNEENRLPGEDCEGLALQGYADAERLAHRIASGGGVDVLYSSIVRRAEQTARIVGKRLGVKVESLAGVHERHLGVFSGHTCEDSVKMAAPEDIFYSGHAPYVLQGYGVETAGEAMERGGEALAKVRSRLEKTGEAALIICHGDIGQFICAAVADIAPEEILSKFSFSNGGIIRITPYNEVFYEHERVA